MKQTRYILLLLLAMIVVACANPGAGPDGGPYDEHPPYIVEMSPKLGQPNAKQMKVHIVFNENIKVENPTEKVTISPPQIKTPTIKFSGKKISVELHDSLKPNTTYTIDFSDAIEDNNEGNPLGQFTYYFSTGDNVDTLEVSGHILDASNLEPVKGMLVGLYADSVDSAFTSRGFERLGRTDATGRFSIKGVAPGNYRLYAVNDQDNNFHFSQKGEMLAFYDKVITPSCYPDMRQDTLWRDTITYDTILNVPFTHFVPDDVVLLAFLEDGQARHFLKTERKTPEVFTTFFTAPSTHVPTIEGLNFDATDAFVENRTKGNDTIQYWLRDSLLMEQDTLRFVYTYETTDDSTGVNFLFADTLEVVPRKTMKAIREEQQEEYEKWKKAQEKRRKKGETVQEQMPPKFLTIGGRRSSMISPIQNQPIEFEEPLARLDTSAIHLLRNTSDSTFVEAPFRLIADPYDLRKFKIWGEWRPGQNYEVHIDSAAIVGISGRHTNKLKFRFTIGTSEDYGSVFFLLPDAPKTAVVQLLKDDKKVVAQVPVQDSRADFFYVEPGEYYARLFVDANGNGKWDTGEYASLRQAEATYYFPQPFSVRANWDAELTWKLNVVHLLKQKPEQLRKTKHNNKEKQTARQRNIERQRNK
ncbi:MAG: Ig-like domain-containing protein [Bacteroidaceae bacterium]|nr:Ig-like domain-containing protein [Bacteroidaceae bacterium]